MWSTIGWIGIPTTGESTPPALAGGSALGVGGGLIWGDQMLSMEWVAFVGLPLHSACSHYR
jgi:hypothetical protein